MRVYIGSTHPGLQRSAVVCCSSMAYTSHRQFNYFEHTLARTRISVVRSTRNLSTLQLSLREYWARRPPAELGHHVENVWVVFGFGAGVGAVVYTRGGVTSAVLCCSSKACLVPHKGKWLYLKKLFSEIPGLLAVHARFRSNHHRYRPCGSARQEHCQGNMTPSSTGFTVTPIEH